MGFMMNLGNFAGGAAKGYEAGTQLQQRQKQIESQGNLQQAQTANLQQDTQQKQVQFQQQQELKDGLVKLHDQYYGPQTDADGNVTKPASQYGVDPANDIAFTRASIGFQLAKTGDMTKLAPLMQQAQAVADTQEGKELLQATSGDPTAFAAYVTKHGGDPTKAKFNANGANGPEMDMGNGQPPINLKAQLYGLGMYDAASSLGKDSLLPMQKQQLQASIEHEKAATAHENAETAIAPDKGAMWRNYGAARVTNANARAGGGGPQVSPQLTRMATSVSTDPLTKSMDPDKYTYILGEAANNGKNPTGAISAAASKYQMAADKFNTRFLPALRQMPPDQLQQRFGITKLDSNGVAAIRRQAIQAELGAPKPFTEADPSPAGNVGSNLPMPQ